jgi:polyprenyl P-hydroxybenzoate/phenylacrylic acid decarboxylase-like protein
MTTPGDPPRLVVGLSGSSSPQLGIALLRALQALGTVETHLVMSAGARRTVELEADMDPDEVLDLADVTYDPGDMAASVSSGSFRTMGMVIAPCSMKTLAGVACGMTIDLLGRAADVTLKERRPLVLVTRETPLSLIHLRNMVAVTEAGAIVLPPMPAFYHRPKTIDDLLNQSVGKVLDQFGVEHDLFRRWQGPEAVEASVTTDIRVPD